MGGGRKARGEGWGGGGGWRGWKWKGELLCVCRSGRFWKTETDEVGAVGHCIAVQEVGQSREETAGQF